MNSVTPERVPAVGQGRNGRTNLTTNRGKIIQLNEWCDVYRDAPCEYIL